MIPAIVGVLLCFTVIGAIIGVPMALLGGAMFGWGFVKSRQKKANKQD